MIKIFNFKKLNIKNVWVILLPFVIVLFSEMITKASFTPSINIKTYFIASLLLFFIGSLLYLVIEDMFKVYAISFGVVFLLSCMSYFKYAQRETPLYITDFQYLSKMAGLAHGSLIVITNYIVITLIMGILVGYIVHKYNIKIMIDKTFKKKTFAALTACLAITLTFNYFAVRTNARQTVFLSEYLGTVAVPYGNEGALKDLTLENYNKTYLKNAAEKIKSSIPAGKIYSDKKPNVIVIMSESFFDLNTLKGLELSEDPIPNYRDLCKESVHGNMVSISYGGGTADVEFEVQTGMQNRFFNITTTFFEKMGKENVLSLATIFKEKGYKTVGLHTYTGKFYNRSTVYPNLGYDKFIGSEDIENPKYDGLYISDSVITDLIINEIEQNKEPTFIYAVTMENHQPYKKEKYGETDIKVLNDDMEILMKESIESYAYGIRNSDYELKRLTDYFRNSNEPTVIVFFGDHQPTLGPDFSVYKYTGDIVDIENRTPEDYLKLLKTQFLIWSNEKSEEKYCQYVGGNFLGNLLLNELNMEKPLFYHFLDEYNKKILYSSRNTLFIDAEGNLAYDIPKEYNAIFELYGLFQYDMILGEGYLKTELESIVK